jgi:hypothetical protein
MHENSFPSEREKQRIEKVVKFAARLCLNNFQENIQCEDLLSKLNWKPVSGLVLERRLIKVKIMD